MVSYGEREKLPRGLYWRPDSPYIWYGFRLQDSDKTISGSTETTDRKLAMAVRDKARGDAVQGKIKPKESNITLREMVEKALWACRKDPSHKDKKSSLENVLNAPMLKGKKAKSILPSDLEEYQNWRSEQRTISTVNRELGYLGACYAYAIKKEKLNLTNPCREIKAFDEKPRQRQRPLLDDEKRLLFNDPKLDKDMRDCYLFDMQTGLRQGELLDAQWPHLDWEKSVLKVKTLKKKRKGGLSAVFKYVPLTTDSMDILSRRRLEGWPIKSPYIFCDDQGKRRSKWGKIITSLRWACKRNKIENFRFHDLRHTFGTDFTLATNGDFKSLSEILGHSIQKTTERYVHYLPSHKFAQIQKLPKIASIINQENHVGTTLENEATDRK